MSTREYDQGYYQQCMADPDCKKRKQESRKRTKQKYKEQGRCELCGNPLVEGRTLCLKHLWYKRMLNWLKKCSAVDLLGGGCSVCGQTDVRILEFDHKNNDGAQHRRELGLERTAGVPMVFWILRHPDEAKQRLQVLCANCHAYKRYERSWM